MVQIIDDKGNILAHIHIDVVRTLQQIRSLVYQIGCQDPVNKSVLIIFVKFCKAIGKKTEGRADKYLSRLSSL